MDITIIICTYNRVGNLASCIGALGQQQDVDSLAWEVLVIDNNSSDGTGEEVARLAQGFRVPVRCVRETEQGLNYARNRGALEATGHYCAYIDDDILVSPGWLHALYHALQDNQAAAAGGRILLDPDLDIPKWIKPEMYGFLGHQDFGDESFEMDGSERYPFGGNMAFLRDVLLTVGKFDVNMGRKGEGRKREELFKGEELDYFQRVKRGENAYIAYEPRAIVFHQVLPHQLKKRYFRILHFNSGLQRALLGGPARGKTVLGVPLYLFPQLLRAGGRYLMQAVTRGPDWAFRQQMTVANFVGMMIGHYRSRNRATA
ncbi:MAG: glycosyltransferase family 2 protein [Chromatiales bacterium]|nr:glycosyltransferase family 2 protein [Chromatiales bacterium]